MLPADSADGKLDWRALLAESGAMVAARYDPVAYLDNTRTDTQVRSAVHQGMANSRGTARARGRQESRMIAATWTACVFTTLTHCSALCDVMSHYSLTQSYGTSHLSQCLKGLG